MQTQLFSTLQRHKSNKWSLPHSRKPSYAIYVQSYSSFVGLGEGVAR